jgi:hypothetical protein
MKRLIDTLASTGQDRMKQLLTVLVLFIIMDGLVTEYLVGGGLAREGNPLLEPLVGNVGFMLVKTAGALICTIGATWCFVTAYAVILAWNSSIFLG